MIQGGEATGYTIVETMIFLAVTAMLFISALSLISGRQAGVQFAQATRDAQSKLQDIINQVSSGFYPNGDGFSCTVAGTSGPALDLSTPKAQGTSDDCVFLGKVVELGVGTDQDGYNVVSVAARRLNTSGLEVNSLAQAKPTAIALKSAADTNTPDVTDKSVFQYGLKVTRVTVPATATTPGPNYGAIAFLGSFPSGAQTNLTSGAQHVNFGAVPGTTLNQDYYQSILAINAITDAAGYTDTLMSPDASLANGIVVCLSDGGSRKAWLTIGGNVTNTTVRLDIGSSTICP